MAEDTSEEILKYIKTEKEISRFKLKKMRGGKNISPAKRRVIEIEEEFLSLPLETWGFEDVADVASAISIYRDSRSLFYKTFDFPKPKELSKKEIFDLLDKKFLFLDKISKQLTSNRIEELNPVQDKECFEDLLADYSKKNLVDPGEAKTFLKDLPLDKLLKLESLTVAKKRARKQASLYSSGVYLKKELVKIKIDNLKSRRDALDMISSIDLIVENWQNNIFRDYNFCLSLLPNKLKGSFGENYCISKIHSLKNLFDFDEILKDVSYLPQPIGRSYEVSSPFIGCVSDKDIFPDGISKDEEKKSKSKTIGILLPIERLGNEKMTCMYVRVHANGVYIQNLFDNYISNVKAISDHKAKYFKAFMTKPLWELISQGLSDKEEEILSYILNFPLDSIDALNNKENLERINEGTDRLVKLDIKKSSLLVPKTRSEENSFSVVKPWINKRIKDIISEYKITTNETFLG